MTPQPESDITLRGPWLTLARAIWIALVILALAPWAAGLAPRYQELLTPCAEETCAFLTLSPQEAATLKEAGLSLAFYAGYQSGVEIFNTLAFILLAGLIFWRRSDERMGWLVSLTLAVLGVTAFSNADDALLTVYSGMSPLFDLLLALPLIFLLLLFYLFPDGRFVPRWTRLVTAIMVVYLLVAAPLAGGVYPLFLTPGILRTITYILMLGSWLAGAFAQVYRYRRVSGPAQRQQTKWVVFGFCALILGMMIWTLTIELFPLPPGPARLYLNLVGVGVICLVILLFPLSLAIAILRYRLWDIDVLINRTMVYGALTGALALVYFGIVVLLQGLFRALTGQGSQIAVVASTLAIAALFAPLRRRVQDLIDRRFYRRKYDAEKVLAEFAATVRDEVDLDKLTAELLRVVEETMQPEFVSLWLAPTAESRKTSTAVSVGGQPSS